MTDPNAPPALALTTQQDQAVAWLLTTHRFGAQEPRPLTAQEAFFMATPQTTPTPPSSPMMGMPPQAAPPGPPALDPLAEQDDLPLVQAPVTVVEQIAATVAATPGTLTPAAPPGADPGQQRLPPTFGEHEALLQGFCQHLLRRVLSDIETKGKEVCTVIDDTWRYLQAHIQADKDRLRHAETALDALMTKAVTEGIQLRHDPYLARVQVVSPQGFSVTLEVRKATPLAVIDELTEMNTWLAAQGYTAPARIQTPR